MERLSVQEYRAIIAGTMKLPDRPARKSTANIPKPAPPENPLARILGPVRTGSLLLKPEEQLASEFGSALRAGALDGRLRGIFCHVPNEIAGQARSKRAAIRYAIAKAMGLIEGTADYLFLWENGGAALEAKTGKGKQTDGQSAYQIWCERENVPYFIFRSVEEGFALLTDIGIWMPRT